MPGVIGIYVQDRIGAAVTLDDEVGGVAAAARGMAKDTLFLLGPHPDVIAPPGSP